MPYPTNGGFRGSSRGRSPSGFDNQGFADDCCAPGASSTALTVTQWLVTLVAIGLSIGALVKASDSSNTDEILHAIHAGSKMSNFIVVENVATTGEPPEGLNSDIGPDGDTSAKIDVAKFKAAADKMYEKFFVKECYDRDYVAADAIFKNPTSPHIVPTECIVRYYHQCSGGTLRTDTYKALCHEDMAAEVKSLAAKSPPATADIASSHDDCWHNNCGEVRVNGDFKHYAMCTYTHTDDSKILIPRKEHDKCLGEEQAIPVVVGEWSAAAATSNKGIKVVVGSDGVVTLSAASAIAAENSACTCREYKFFTNECSDHTSSSPFPANVQGLKCADIRVA